mmetsp:Transcript_83125/g.235788  ORF Transcript_83125/g.235788 Transcript_83125/m.235788 type:complete len:289 (-) Transcript_83125:336-1202(-)
MPSRKEAAHGQGGCRTELRERDHRPRRPGGRVLGLGHFTPGRRQDEEEQGAVRCCRCHYRATTRESCIGPVAVILHSVAPDDRGQDREGAGRDGDAEPLRDIVAVRAARGKGHGAAGGARGRLPPNGQHHVDAAKGAADQGGTDVPAPRRAWQAAGENRADHEHHHHAHLLQAAVGELALRLPAVLHPDALGRRRRRPLRPDRRQPRRRHHAVRDGAVPGRRAAGGSAVRVETPRPQPQLRPEQRRAQRRPRHGGPGHEGAPTAGPLLVEATALAELAQPDLGVVADP